MSLKLLTASRQVDSTVKCPCLSYYCYLKTVAWYRGGASPKGWCTGSRSVTPFLRAESLNGKVWRYTLRERAQPYRKESFKPSLAACAKLSLSAGHIVTPLRTGVDSHSSSRCSSDAAARALDALELPGPASRLLLVMLAASPPWAHLNGVQVSKEALQLALSFFRSQTV